MASIDRGGATLAALVVALGIGASACATPGIENPLPPITADAAISPSPEPSPEEIEDGDWVVPEGDERWAEGWEKVVPRGITFPAQTDPNYEFSDEPQSRAERWLHEHWPEQWDLGVRAVSDFFMTPGSEWAVDPSPAVLVQYINGERAEGTEDMPLGFRGQATDINEYPTDVYPNMLQSLRESRSIQEAGAIGQGGYSVSIQEHYGTQRGVVITTTMRFYSAVGVTGAGDEKKRNFDTWRDAWAFIEENGFLPNKEGARKVYPGEITSVVVMKELESGISQTVLLNPETGEWTVVAEYR